MELFPIFFFTLTWQDETQPAVWLVVHQVETQIYQISINQFMRAIRRGDMALARSIPCLVAASGSR